MKVTTTTPAAISVPTVSPAAPQDFLTGFLQGDKVNGRPADVFRYGSDAFLVTDDRAGVVYYVYRK